MDAEKCSAIQLNTWGFGRFRDNSLHTLVSISTENLTIVVNGSFGQFQLCAIGGSHQMIDKFARRHGAYPRGMCVNRWGVRTLEQRPQFGLHRPAIGSGSKPCALLDGIVNVSDRHAPHRSFPMIAMQSMYAMKAMLSNA
jgi:hypothetical protein